MTPEDMDSSIYSPDLSQVSQEDIDLAIKILAIRRKKYNGPSHNKGSNIWI